jgi:hypothetical protein
MSTCDFCHLEKSTGKPYVLYTAWEMDAHTTELLVARVTRHTYSNFVRHDFFVCKYCSSKRWLAVLGVLAGLALIIALLMSPAFGTASTKAGTWVFGISFFLFFILFGPLFLNFKSIFITRLKKQNRGVEVFSEADYRSMTRSRN